MADIFDIVADANRRAILEFLLQASGPGGNGEATADELVLVLGLTKQSVNRQLGILVEGGLVQAEGEGAERVHRLVPEGLDALGEWVEPFLEASITGLAHSDDTAVLSAWAGERMPDSLRRAAERLPEPSEVGDKLGRALAEANVKLVEPVRSRVEPVVERAADTVEPLVERVAERVEPVVERIKGRLRRKD
jgi:ArsR family transcriptional regulator, arsenate/arsenite/antimonite-responsive transcriptional repressor